MTMIEDNIAAAPSDEPGVKFLTSKDIQSLTIDSLDGLTPEIKATVVSKLQSLCGDLVNQIDLRFVIPDLFQTAIKLFHDENLIDKPNSKLVISILTNTFALQLQHPTLSERILDDKVGFDNSVIEFLKFKKRCKGLRIEKVYQQFYMETPKDSHVVFKESFEFTMIKSYSEAYCETVGSLMNNLINKNRNLFPANFSHELICSFNSPPLHILKQKIIPEIAAELVRQGKEFRRKLDDTNKASMLAFTTSASIGNYRKQREEDSHIPVKIFLDQ